MKRLFISGVLLLSTQVNAFETEAGCKKMLFKGTAQSREKVELCLLYDDNFHLNIYDKSNDELEEKVRVHFDIERSTMSFFSVGTPENYSVSFSFKENDLTYVLHHTINEDDEITALISIVNPQGESVMYEYIIPSTLRLNYAIEDVSKVYLWKK